MTKLGPLPGPFEYTPEIVEIALDRMKRGLPAFQMSEEEKKKYYG